jgi:peptidoglycan/xylan/chitin deacetylase (PgdA/CDA1 family)
MTRYRHVEGNITETTGGNYKVYGKDMVITSQSDIIKKGETKGVTFNEPEKPKKISNLPNKPSLILMYHQIDPILKSTDDVTDTNFKLQMEWLKENKYNTVATEDLFKGPLPPKSVLITFDDGYVGNYTFAKPILESLNMKADFYVHTDYVGVPATNNSLSWGHMSWDELKTLDKSPLFGVYSHTKSHPKLTEITPEELTIELVESKKKLEQELGGARKFIAYPYGDYNLNVINAAQKAGYLMALAVANKGVFDKLSHYSYTRIGIGSNVTTINSFKKRIKVQ